MLGTTVVSLGFIINAIWVLAIHIESIFFFIYKKKFTNIKVHNATYDYLPVYNHYLVFFWCLGVIFFFDKTLNQTIITSYITAIIFFSIYLGVLLHLAQDYFVRQNVLNLNFIILILQNLTLFLILLPLVQSLLEYLFIIEFYNVFYYFFFLSFQVKYTRQGILKFKNMIFFFLWNSFLTTIIFGFGLFILAYTKGSVNFNELYLLADNTFLLNFGLIIILFSILVKLGIPGFHFLKVEIYKYLNWQIIIFFSIITLSFNLFLFYFLVLQPVFLLIFNKFFLFIILPLFMFFTVYYYQKITNIYIYLAWSSIVTVFTSLLPLLV